MSCPFVSSEAPIFWRSALYWVVVSPQTVGECPQMGFANCAASRGYYLSEPAVSRSGVTLELEKVEHVLDVVAPDA